MLGGIWVRVCCNGNRVGGHRRRDGGYRRRVEAVAAVGAPKEAHRLPGHSVQGLPSLPISVKNMMLFFPCSMLEQLTFRYQLSELFQIMIPSTLVLPTSGHWLPYIYLEIGQ